LEGWDRRSWAQSSGPAWVDIVRLYLFFFSSKKKSKKHYLTSRNSWCA
jgi:hypothetical protein